jgi:hypothetical protein
MLPGARSAAPRPLEDSQQQIEVAKFFCVSLCSMSMKRVAAPGSYSPVL